MDFMTLEQVAIQVNRSADTVRRWAKIGLIPHRKVLGRLVFDPKDVKKLLTPKPQR